MILTGMKRLEESTALSWGAISAGVSLSISRGFFEAISTFKRHNSQFLSKQEGCCFLMSGTVRISKSSDIFIAGG